MYNEFFGTIMSQCYRSFKNQSLNNPTFCTIDINDERNNNQRPKILNDLKNKRPNSELPIKYKAKHAKRVLYKQLHHNAMEVLENQSLNNLTFFTIR